MLATPAEHGNWARLGEIGRRLQNLNSPATVALQQKQRLLAGLMLWDFEQVYAERLWMFKKNVQALEAQLQQSVTLQAALTQARDQAPQRFGQFDQRIDEITPRIDAQLVKLDHALNGHQQYLADLAADQIDLHENRLIAYLTEAQFALATGFDRAALLKESP